MWNNCVISDLTYSDITQEDTVEWLIINAPNEMQVRNGFTTTYSTQIRIFHLQNYSFPGDESNKMTAVVFLKSCLDLQEFQVYCAFAYTIFNSSSLCENIHVKMHLMKNKYTLSTFAF